MADKPTSQTTTCDGPACPNFIQFSAVCCKLGICGGENKKFDPQVIRRVVDGVIIEEFVQ